MAKFYNKVRSGATMREKVELLLESNPYKIAQEAPTNGTIEDEEEASKSWPKPLIYNHNNLSEVSEFFAIYLEIFLHDHDLNTESRKAKAEERFHEKITELEGLVKIFEERFSLPFTNDDTLKAVAKENLDEVIHSLANWEKELAELGRKVFHSVKNDPREVAFFIVKKLAALRREAERRGSIGAKTAEERVNRIFDYLRPDYFHRRFFQVILGFKCEELKSRIDNYKIPPKKDITSMAETAPEWPLSEEFFEWLRNSGSKVNLLLLASRVSEFEPYRGLKSYHKKKAVTKLCDLTGAKQLKEFNSKLSTIRTRCNSLEELAGLLNKVTEGEHVEHLLKELKLAPLRKEEKAKIDELLLLPTN